MSELKGNREDRLVCLLGLIIAVGTLACYWPTGHSDFINLDDSLYVYQNRTVQQGLSWPGFVWAFKSVEGGNWHPLVWLSHMTDCQVYGLEPGGHHLTNLILHAASAVLLLLVLKNMTGAIWRSAVVAALFAWHPMHVESVAWVAERKDVLSTFFWLLTMGAYAGFSKATGARRKLYYGLALLLFTLGLMCKSMLVTLPCVLLLLDYWPLRRTESPRKLAAEKLPFLVLSIVASVLVVWTQEGVKAVGNAPMFIRLENATVCYAAYLGKFLWPVHLAFFYPFPHSIPIWQVIGAIMVLGAVSWVVIQGMKKRRYLAVGWFWFLGTLLPVIGLVEVGMQSMADRYSYVPYIGLAMMVSWGLADLTKARPRIQSAVTVAAALALACCLAATHSQVKYWQNNTALYERALQVTSGNYLAHSKLGETLMDSGKLDEAVKHFQEAIQLHPNAAAPYNDLGAAYAQQGKLEDATTQFLKAITTEPEFEKAQANLGNAYKDKGKMAEAVAAFKTALRLKPDDFKVQRTLAAIFLKTGRAVEALPYCEAVVARYPDDAYSQFALGSAHLAQKLPGEAKIDFQKAVRLAPDNPDCLNALAWIYATCPDARLRNGGEAVKLASRACNITKRKKPDFLDTLAAAYAETGRFDEAVKTAEEIQALAAATHDTAAADMARERLRLYQAGKPYRDEAPATGARHE